MAFLIVRDAAYNLVHSPTILGTAEDAHVRFSENYVSGWHLLLVRQGRGWAVVDWRSTNGTFVNDQLIAECTLVGGDWIEIRGAGPANRIRVMYGESQDLANRDRAPTVETLLHELVELQNLVRPRAELAAEMAELLVRLTGAGHAGVAFVGPLKEGGATALTAGGTGCLRSASGGISRDRWAPDADVLQQALGERDALSFTDPRRRQVVATRLAVQGVVYGVAQVKARLESPLASDAMDSIAGARRVMALLLRAAYVREIASR